MNIFNASNAKNFSTLNAVISHVCVDIEHYENFMDWLGFVFQHRIATGNGWIFQGTQASGKTFLLHSIMRKLFPDNMLAITSNSERMPSAKYTPLMVFADETTEKLLRNPKFSSAAKKIITSESSNLVMASSEPIKNSITGARRLTLTPYQHESLPFDQDALRLALETEVPALVSYLQSLDIPSTLS